MQLELVDAGYGDDLTEVLIAEIQDEMTVRYGGPDCTPVDPVEFRPPLGAFLVALVDGDLVGCVGLRAVVDEHAVTDVESPGRDVELKRMYVRFRYRRSGIGRALLQAAEERARSLGYRRILLETGLGQPEAIGLYEAAGYERVTGFGHYARQPDSRAFAKRL
ncbi:MAG: GNAT family N-acetyltransferase [Actinomycetes bacterium]